VQCSGEVKRARLDAIEQRRSAISKRVNDFALAVRE